MNGWVILRRARITLLFLLALICFTWAILFAIVLHHEWPYSSLLQKIVVVGLLSLYVFTAILLYLMAVVHYCPWWDAVRMFAILVVHTGSSVFFTHYRPSFPCRGFGAETACKEFIFMIFVGCWVFSVTFLCFAIALGVMAFIPQPVESLPGTEEDGLASNPVCFRASSPTADEQRTFLSSIELPESLSPADRNTCPANSVHRVIIPWPVESLQGTEDDDSPLNPGWFKVGSPTADERRTPLSSIRTGSPVIELPESLSPDRSTCLVNNIPRVIITRPVKSLQGTEDDDSPSNSGWFKVGSPTADERRTFLSSTRTGLVTHDNQPREESLSSDRNASPVNSIHSTLEPPHFWQNFENRNSRHSNETGSHSGTLSMRNTPGGDTSTDSGSLRVGAFSPYSFHDTSTPPVSIYSHSPFGRGRGKH